jgi:hypothetical protein
MQSRTSRALADLWRRTAPAPDGVLGEPTTRGRAVRALLLLLVVAVLGAGGYLVGRAMKEPPSHPQAEPAGPTASYDGGQPQPTEAAPTPAGRTPGGRDAKPTPSATDRFLAPAPGIPTLQPMHPRATGRPTPAATNPAGHPSAHSSPNTSPNPPTNPSTSPSAVPSTNPTTSPPPAAPTTSATPKDTTPPQTSLTEAFPVSDGAVFTFSASEPATFACSLDGAAYTACGSPQRYQDLAAGWHTFAVRATDAAGNTDPTPARSRWHANKRDG